ncbi:MULTISPECIES: SDR family oxidoreductase [unclassified Arthrobacter]|uniref:SDR family NAD(P)-dependent oxidoreductase n=1 Tax=unclassified Arthrobacter TaxID=235627 RepID=UPI00159DAD7A|nr:SDR family oxidoreductase [Arthrobacter sp. STN4]MCQ9162613.1 SDR family oxidoreductase [Arthrobacter sp. STN4]NVM97404.1 SDR family oxidoreductase [Arthrobacter sp. SDTb3-6]
MPPTALITGATSGLGAEFAQQLARSRHSLVLVARDVARLEAKAARLRQDFGVDVEVLPADLLTDDGVARVGARLADRARPVGVLVNNAGFGLVTAFEHSSVKEETDQLRILVRTPMQLMHAALEGMLERGSGRIINVASVAGFIPRGSYGAAKAWVISFSRFANLRYGPRGVHVTAVCPGFVHTEFHQRMGANMGRIPKWMWLDPEPVVREGLADSARGKSVSIPSRRYSTLIALSRLVPDRVAAAAGNRGR